MAGLHKRALVLDNNDYNNRFDINCDDNIDNNRPAVEWPFLANRDFFIIKKRGRK